MLKLHLTSAHFLQNVVISRKPNSFSDLASWVPNMVLSDQNVPQNPKEYTDEKEKKKKTKFIHQPVV